MSAKLEWFGQAGHLCVADSCRFHLHTHVNGFCVSTVDEYYPPGATKPETVGCDRLYETMVFKLNAAGDDVESWAELTCVGYNDRDAANTGHMEQVRKWGGL